MILKKRGVGVCAAALLLSALLLAGCAPAASGAVQTPETAQAETQEPVWASLFCDVSFWKPPAWDISPDSVTGQITENTGLALKITVPPQNADMQLSLMLLKDEIPDVICLTDATMVSQLVTSGKVWDMEEFLRAYCPDSHLLKQYPGDLKRALIKRDGGWYAFPSHINTLDCRNIWQPSSNFYVERRDYGNNRCIIWNRALLAQAGLEVTELQTETQVLAAFEKAKTMQVDGKPVIPLLVDGKQYLDPTLKYLQASFGAEYVDDEGNYRDIVLQPQTKHALQFLNTAVRRGYLPIDELTMTNEQVKTDIAGGRVLCFIGNVDNTNMQAKDWVSTGAVLSDTGDLPVQELNTATPTGWISTFVSKKCENPEQIAKWIDYMSSDEGMMRWDFGTEGVDYLKNTDGNIVRTSEGERKHENASTTGLTSWWMFSNTAFEESVIAPPVPGEQEYERTGIVTAFGRTQELAYYNSALLAMPAQELLPSSEQGQIQTKINEYIGAQLNAVVLAESDAAFETAYQEMISRLKNLGIDTLDAKKNEIYKKNCAEYGETITRVNPDAG